MKIGMLLVVCERVVLATARTYIKQTGSVAKLELLALALQARVVALEVAVTVGLCVTSLV